MILYIYGYDENLIRLNIKKIIYCWFVVDAVLMMILVYCPGCRPVFDDHIQDSLPV